MVEEHINENDMTQMELAKKLNVSKGYISQILNGNSDHRLSKIVSLAVALDKAPYVYFKDLNQVISDDSNGKGVFINFEEVESKASRCDLLESYSNLVPDASLFYRKKYWPPISDELSTSSYFKFSMDEEMTSEADTIVDESNDSLDPKAVFKSLSNAA